VLVGSGVKTRDIVRDPALMAALRLDPSRQLIARAVLGRARPREAGLAGTGPACTDLDHAPWVQEAGVTILEQPFHARGNVATAGGCLASQYLAAWIIASLWARRRRARRCSTWRPWARRTSTSSARWARRARTSRGARPSVSAHRDRGARIIVTGGTFDKHYDAIKGELTFKETHLPAILEQARVTVPVAIEINQLIDSLHMTDEHRRACSPPAARRPRARSSSSTAPTRWPRRAQVVGPRGARKTVVFTGAMIPYSVQGSDALFNLGFALALAQALPPAPTWR
jgi:L-asparaginase